VTVAGTDAIEPGRLGELVDGATPRDEAERVMTGLMGALREAEPRAPEALRRRVRRIAAAPAPAGAAGPWRARLRSADRRRMALVAAPVAAAIAAAAVAVPVLTSGGDGSAPDAPAAVEGAARPGQPAAPAAPEAAPADRGADRLVAPATRLRVRVGGAEALPRASARATAVVRSLGGTAVGAARRAPGSVRLAFSVPAARVDEAVAALGRLGTVEGARSRGAPDSGGGGQVAIDLTLAAGAAP
jgi:hypothetical protein